MASSSGASASPDAPPKASIFITPIFRREMDKPSVGYVDINFVSDAQSNLPAAASTTVDRRAVLTFDNYFVSHIAVQQPRADGTYVTM